MLVGLKNIGDSAQRVMSSSTGRVKWSASGWPVGCVLIAKSARIRAIGPRVDCMAGSIASGLGRFGDWGDQEDSISIIGFAGGAPPPPARVGPHPHALPALASLAPM